MTGNRFAFNNQERFAQTGHVSEAAGAKLTRTQGLTVTDNLFEGNYSSGLWLDIDVRNVIIARNVFKENRRHGLFYEISSNGIIASNIALRNGVAGIALSNATHMQVYNNTLFGNAISFLVQADKRMKQMLSKTQLDNGRISSETVFYNNLLAAADRTSKPYIWVRDFSSALNAGQLLSASDFNGFFRRNGYKPTGMVEWWQGGKQHLYKKLSDYQSSAGRDLNSVVLVKEPIDTFVSTRPNTSYAIAPGSFARSAGRNLPPDVAQAIGITNQRSPNLGALSLPGGIAITP